MNDKKKPIPQMTALQVANEGLSNDRQVDRLSDAMIREVLSDQLALQNANTVNRVLSNKLKNLALTHKYGTRLPNGRKRVEFSGSDGEA